MASRFRQTYQRDERRVQHALDQLAQIAQEPEGDDPLQELDELPALPDEPLDTVAELRGKR